MRNDQLAASIIGSGASCSRPAVRSAEPAVTEVESEPSVFRPAATDAQSAVGTDRSDECLDEPEEWTVRCVYAGDEWDDRAAEAAM